MKNLPSQGDNKEHSTSLAARVEYLEAETKHLKSHINTKKAPSLFRIEQIQDNDSLIKFYTGFDSYALFLSFLSFLDHLCTD